MSLTPEEFQEAQKKAMEKLREDIKNCEFPDKSQELDRDKLCQLLVHYYKNGYDDGQKVIIELYKRLITQHSEKLNAATNITDHKDR